MNNIIRALTAVALISWQSFCAADTSVWKVTKGDKDVYIGGTIHVLAESDYPLPDSFQHAYDNSEILAFETDITAISSPSFQMKMLSALTYSGGKTLKTELQPDTLKQLETYFSANGLPLENFLSFKPALLSITLTMLELQKLGITSAGVDKHFHTLGLQDKREIKTLETLEQQLEFFSSMGVGQEDQFILSTLNDMSILPEMMDSMKTGWRQGDSQSLYQATIKPMKADYPDLYNGLLVERNNNWLPQIEAMFETPETEFVLVGALHLIGSDGVIEQLKFKGYKITQL